MGSRNNQLSGEREPASPAKRLSPIVPLQLLIEISDGIRRLESGESRVRIEQALQQLDQTIQRCWGYLGLPNDRDYEREVLDGPSS